MPAVLGSGGSAHKVAPSTSPCMVKSHTHKPLRVLILEGGFGGPGGVGDFLLYLLEHFSGDIQFEHLAVGRSATAKSRIGNIFFPIVDNTKLAWRILRNSVDCIHLNPSLNAKAILRDGLSMLILSLLRFDRVVVFIHGWDAKYEEKIKRYALLKFLLRKTFEKSSVIIVLASSFKESLVEMGFKAEQVRVATTMFDGRILRGIKRQDNKKDKSILFLSRFIREKGVYELLEGFYLISKKFPNVELIMAGEGPEQKGMEKWVNTHRLVDRVRFPGYLRGADKAQVLVDADLFVFPTYGEGCPLALLEAMATGLAVITNAAGGIPDIFKDGENGILLDEVSPKAIGTAMEELLENDAFSRHVMENNRKKAWENYEASIVTKKMELIYKDIAC